MTRRADQTGKQNKPDPLRAQAEANLSHAPSPTASMRPADELLHELRVHQIELEMQNEALRESQLALEESRDRYADLYEFAPVGFVTLNRDALICEINLTGAALLGDDRGKLIRRRFAAFIAQTSRDQWHRAFMHALQQGISHSYELIMQRADGASFHARLDGLHPVNEGRSTMVRFAFADVTRHDLTRAQEERMRHIMNQTMDMIFIFSPDTLRFVYVNKGAIKGMGYDREALLQMTPLDFMPRISEAELHAFLAPLVKGDKDTLRFETELACSGDKTLSVEARLQLVPEPGDGNIFVAVVRDITKRRLAEKELRRQKNLLHQVIDTVPNMIFVRDNTGRFLLANQATADFFGMEIRNMIGGKIAGLGRRPQGDIAFFSSDKEVLDGGREISSTESALMPDGKQRWYLTVKRPLPQPDGSLNILGIAADITDLKQSKNSLAESYSELQKLSLHLENIRSEERAQIGRNLHDEMGAILAALKMRASWLSSRLPEDMPLLRQEAKHILELVSDGIRTVRQITSDLRPNLLDDVGLSAAVGNYIKKFQRDTEIECTIEFPDEDFSLDKNQSTTVFRIIQESLNNIAKHARASQATVRATIQNGAFLLQIKDNGIGFNLDRSMRSFGLLGIRERALMIGGEATISSAPGQGTSVSLNIPLSGIGQAELDYS